MNNLKCIRCIEDRYHYLRDNLYKEDNNVHMANALTTAIHSSDVYEPVTIFDGHALCFNHLREYGKFNK